MNQKDRRTDLHSVIGLVLLVAGWLFYLLERGRDPFGIFPFTGTGMGGAVFRDSMPTLLHAAAFALLFRAGCGSRRSYWWCWSLATFGFELLQALLPVLGTFDVWDLCSIALAIPLAFLATRSYPPRAVVDGHQRIAIAVFAGLTSIATSGPRGSPRITHTVICMQLNELRNGFVVEAPRPLVQSGRIFLNGNLLLISEPFQGIHVFDNTNPAAPVAAAFLKIPGNTDIAMKDSYLYADSAVDLLTIKFDGNNATLVGRVENALEPRTPAEFSDEDFYVPEHQLDACKNSGGVVAGYERREDGANYKSKIEENRND